MKLRWREFLIALFMAVALWYGIAGSEKVETQVMVGVEYKGVPADLVVRSGQVNNLQVRVRASAGMLRTMANRKYVVSLDLSSLVKGANVLSIPRSQLPFQGGVEVIEIIPPQVELHADKLETRKVPVKTEITGELPGDLTLTAQVEPSEVLLRGPSDIIETVRTARLPVPVGANATVGELAVKRPLALPEGVSSIPAEVEVTVKISVKRRLVRITRELRVEKPTGMSLWIRPEKVVISANVPESLVSKAATDPAIRAEAILPDDALGSYTLPVRVHLPDGMEFVRVEPAQVSATLEQHDTVTPRRKK